MPVFLQTTGLLLLSNVFMTFAWYGHLKDLRGKPWLVAALVSWGIALVEYLLQVPANRIGFTAMSLPQLKSLSATKTSLRCRLKRRQARREERSLVIPMNDEQRRMAPFEAATRRDGRHLGALRRHSSLMCGEHATLLIPCTAPKWHPSQRCFSGGQALFSKR